VKIITGAFKGKVLKYPKGRLRPTTDKIRGAVFNMIEANFPDLLPDASVCDIFSGAGAIGIEALSRGAQDVTFIENDKNTLKYLHENLEGLEQSTTVMPMDARKAVEYLKSERFDLIFLDPPYNMNLIEPVIQNIAKYDIVKQNGIIVIEHHKKEIFSMPMNMTIFKRKDYKDTIVTILRRSNEKSSFPG
jgi:16S rRNA (guanine966-N2)-methyltransferase